MRIARSRGIQREDLTSAPVNGFGRTDWLHQTLEQPGEILAALGLAASLGRKTSSPQLNMGWTNYSDSLGYWEDDTYADAENYTDTR